MAQSKVLKIDALLPQTQCGLCGYGGCLPYAEALAKDQATIDLCPPGGVKTLKTLGELLKIDPTPYLDGMLAKTKSRNIAIIRENECIGCTKCIQACPFDAILGSGKQMHTVINVECSGCELCVPPCPVDCIDIVMHPQQLSELTENENKQLANHYRERFNARNQRLEKPEQQTEDYASPTSRGASSRGLSAGSAGSNNLKTPIDDKLAYIKEAILRAKTKKADHKQGTS